MTEPGTPNPMPRDGAVDAASSRDAAPRHDPYSAFRQPAFRVYAISFVLAVLSSAILATTAKFDINALTRDRPNGASLYLGILGAVASIPVLGLSIFAGHVADRFDRKRVLLLTQTILTTAPLVYGLLAWSGAHTVWTVYAIVLANAVALTFARPARGALINVLVPRKDFPNAVTWNSSLAETSSVVGPAIAGLIIGGMQLDVGGRHFVVGGAGLSGALFTAAGCMFLCMLISLALPRSHPSAAAREPATWHTLLAGVRFVANTRLLLAAMSLDLFAVLLGGATYLIPVFADKRLHVGAAGLGLMFTAPAAGAMLMALVQAHRPPYRRAGRALLVSIIGFGLATIAFGLSTNYWLSLGMLFLIGAFDNVSVVVRHSLVQLLTPDSMRGRVGAVNQVFVGASNEIGGFESGITAHAFGPVASVVGGGVGVIAVVAVVAMKFPEVRRLGRLHDVVAREVPPPTLRTPGEVAV